MSRDVRRVPVGYKPPKVERKRWKPGQGYHLAVEYQPQFDQTYAEALAEWKAEKQLWDERRAEYASPEDYDKYTFAEWHGEAPDREWYRPEWPSDAVMGYCLYETVSEGTPISPVFETEEGLARWLATSPREIGIGGSPLAMTIDEARRFVGIGWAPTMVGSMGSGVQDGVSFVSKTKD